MMAVIRRQDGRGCASGGRRPGPGGQLLGGLLLGLPLGLMLAGVIWLVLRGGMPLDWAAPSAAIGAKLLPLYLVAALGVAVGRLVELDRATVGTVLVRAVSPVVFFGAVAMAPVAPVDLGFIAVFFLLPTAICLGVRGMVQPVLGPAEARLSAFLTGSANVGYFGVPAAIAVLPPGALGAYMLSLLGFAVYENTVGYYMMARSGAGVRDGLRRVLRLPAAHAIALGLVANWAGARGSAELHEVWEAFRGCYVVLGMLALGFGLAGVARLLATARFVLVTTLVRLLAWPATAAALVMLDGLAGSPLGPQLRLVAPLFAALPCATSGAIFAAELGLEPEKAAACVLATTLLALITVPLLALVLPALG